MTPCNIQPCDKTAYCRGLCTYHYGKHQRLGNLDEVANPRKAYHYLSDIDEDTATADCAYCKTRVPLYYRKPESKWICRNSRTIRNCLGGKYTYGDGKFVPPEIAISARTKFEEQQGGLCAICKKPSEKALALDHCHETGEVRGLLCTDHNLALGLFQDNIDHLRVAIEYLQRSSSGPPAS